MILYTVIPMARCTCTCVLILVLDILSCLYICSIVKGRGYNIYCIFYNWAVFFTFFSSWVSGIGSVHHPQVWTACVSYTKSSSLSDRVWWEDNDDDGGGGDGGRDGSFLLLVYVQGTTQPSFWQCSTKTGRDGLMGTRNIPFEIASGDTSIQVKYADNIL